MSTDFLDQLAHDEIPPVPVELGVEVHREVNRHLLAIQMLDFAARALPWAFLQFGRAVWAVVRFTVVGKFREPPRGGARQL
jgi:hypothetical protein